MKSFFGLLSFVLFFGLIDAFGQFIKVNVQVDGLTCSACSYATQKSLMAFDFIDSVQMDLNTHIVTIRFKPGKKVEIDKIAQKVIDAGFSVGSLTADYNFNRETIVNDFCMSYEGDTYHFIKTDPKKVNALRDIKFIGEKYMRKKDFRKWKSLMTGECKYPPNYVNSGKTYFVTLE